MFSFLLSFIFALVLLSRVYLLRLSKLIFQFASSHRVSIQEVVKIFNNSCLDVEITGYSAILDALDSRADLSKDSHFVTREVKFSALKV